MESFGPAGDLGASSWQDYPLAARPTKSAAPNARHGAALAAVVKHLETEHGVAIGGPPARPAHRSCSAWAATCRHRPRAGVLEPLPAAQGVQAPGSKEGKDRDGQEQRHNKAQPRCPKDQPVPGTRSTGRGAAV